MFKTDLVQTLSGHMGCVWDVSWSPDGNSLASCGNDKVIKIWNKVSESPLSYKLKTILSDGHTRTIRSVCWSPCGNRIASSSFDATVGIWSRKDGEFDLEVNLEGHENEVKCTAWSSCGQLLATCGRDKLVCIYDVSSEDCDYEIAAILQSHIQDVKKVAWHPNAELLASCSYDGTIKLFKPALGEDDWTCITTFPRQDDTIWSITFDGTGKRLASCSDDGTVKIWQEYTSGNELNISASENEPVWKCVCTLSGCHSKPVYDIAWCHLTSLIATASGDNNITIFKEDKTTDGHLPSFIVVKQIFTAHDEDVNSVSWNPKIPGILASASDNGEIKIWNFLEYEE